MCLSILLARQDRQKQFSNSEVSIAVNDVLLMEMYLDQYHYQGVLQIIDAERFQLAVQRGIGPGKSYGLGMLMLSQPS